MSVSLADADVPEDVIRDAKMLAQKLGHAAVVVVRARERWTWKTCDSWTALPDGFKVWAYVSRDGKVRRLA